MSIRMFKKCRATRFSASDGTIRFFYVPPQPSKNRSSPENLVPPLLVPPHKKLGPPLNILVPRGTKYTQNSVII